MPRPPARKPQPYHHGDLRRALLDGALAIVERTGASTLSLRDLARQLGVSHAAPYRHFANREALLVELAIEGFRGLGAEMQRQLLSARSPLERVHALGLAYVRYALGHPGHFRIMFSRTPHEGTDARLLEAAMPTLEALVDAVAAHQAAGGTVAGNARVLAAAAWSMVHGLALLLIEGQLTPLVPDAIDAGLWAQAAVDVVVRGVAPAAGRLPAPLTQLLALPIERDDATKRADAAAALAELEATCADAPPRRKRAPAKATPSRPRRR